jgi:pimeloyl-ACP methyl ester carboxylesterase
VQPEVAKTTRVCTYDRAGMGYSEAGPLPRTAAQFAQELHAVLQNAQIPGPYVLVGHSLGGLPVRVFAREYQADVAGLVLIESMNQSRTAQSRSNGPTPPDERSPADWFLTLPARIGLVRLLAGPLDLTAGLAPEVAGAYTAFFVTPRYVQTTLDEGRGIPESLAQAGSVTSLGALPLTVLSRGRDPDPDWQQQQADLLHLSSRSRQVIAASSGHNVQIDEPAAAVEAIATLIDQIRLEASPN